MLDSPKNENNSESAPAQQADKSEDDAKPEGGREAWCTVAGRYGVTPHAMIL